MNHFPRSYTGDGTQKGQELDKGRAWVVDERRTKEAAMVASLYSKLKRQDLCIQDTGSNTYWIRGK